MATKQEVWSYCKQLLSACSEGKLGYMQMPEDTNPWFTAHDREQALRYFTLPMALNYQRNSYKLRQSALESYRDEESKKIYDLEWVTNAHDDELRSLLLRYKLALQPNKHTNTRKTIATSIFQQWWSCVWLLNAAERDFLWLQTLIQSEYKKAFPYLSWPKIFHYRSSIIQSYAFSPLVHSEYIDIAPDTHVIQASLKLGVITTAEANKVDREAISDRRRTILDWSDITPIQMHSPLWFWSRNNFSFVLESV